MSSGMLGGLLLAGGAGAQPGRADARADLLLPLTGGTPEVRAEARDMADAARLALDDVGARSSARVALAVTDTGGSAETAAAAARVARAAGSRLILGPLFAREATAVGAAVPEVPVVSFSNDRSIARRGLYVAGFQPETEVGAVARYARRAGFGPLSVFGPAGALHERIRAALERNGDLATSTTYAPGEVAAAAERLVARLIALRPAVTPVVFITTPPGALAAAADALQAASRRQGPLQLAGGAAMAEAVARDPGRLVAALWAGVDPLARRGFEDRVRRRTGRAPQRLTGLGYDAAFLAASLVSEGRVSVAEVERPSGFLGVDGLFRFAADGVVDRALAVIQNTPGGPYVVAPAPRSFGR